MKLKVGYIKEGIKALGPGNRFVIWTQGCSRMCVGCASPEFQPLDGGYWVETNDLANQICSCRIIDGITISGGEPFLQAEALCELLIRVNTIRPELTIIVFTGNKLEELTDINSKAFLGYIDVLIDGEYLPQLNDGRGLRGSSNQRFQFLTGRLSNLRDEFENCERKAEVYWVDKDRRKMVTIGVPRSNRGPF